MKTVHSSLIAAALVAAGLSVPLAAAAQDMNSSTATENSANVSNDSNASASQNTELAHIDKSFAMKAAKGGEEEVAISRIAVQRTTNPQVKVFAQKMIDDHTSANESLTSIATSKGVQLPQKEIDTDKWSKMDASEFDKEYIDKMVDDHKSTVELFQKEADDGKDADLTAFARKTLPTVQEHLEHAEDLKRSLSSK